MRVILKKSEFIVYDAETSKADGSQLAFSVDGLWSGCA